jgi:C-terminal processing protease CtpA/Prc
LGVPRMGIGFDYADGGEGVLVDSLSEGKPAIKAGLKPGDRILEVNGKAIENMEGYMKVMRGFKAGQELNLVVQRPNAADKLKFKVIGE